MADLLIWLLAGIAASIAASILTKAVGAVPSSDVFGKDKIVAALWNLALFVAMLAGIFANYFWTHGVGPPTDINQFWKPVLVSPIIFLAVYVAATNRPRGLIPVLLGFQNGFFWQTVLEKTRA